MLHVPSLRSAIRPQRVFVELPPHVARLSLKHGLSNLMRPMMPDEAAEGSRRSEVDVQWSCPMRLHMTERIQPRCGLDMIRRCDGKTASSQLNAFLPSALPRKPEEPCLVMERVVTILNQRQVVCTCIRSNIARRHLHLSGSADSTIAPGKPASPSSAPLPASTSWSVLG